VTALMAGRSLLPAASRRSRGLRARRLRAIRDEGRELARGLVAYDRAEAERIVRRKTAEIEAILGYAGRGEMIHRDDMALHGSARARREDETC
jgi:glutamate 5-kinase